MSNTPSENDQSNTEQQRPQRPAQPNGGYEQPDATRPSVTDLATQPITKAYAKFFAGIYGFAAVGIGLVLFVLDIVNTPVVTYNYETWDASQDAVVAKSVGVPMITGEIMYPLLFAIGIAVSVSMAVLVARDTNLPEQNAKVIATVGTGVGTATLVTIGTFLASQKLRIVEQINSITQQATLSQYYTVNIGNLFINAILIGAVTGLIAAGVVHVVRNYSPRSA
jgi:hypothetical protein